MALQVTKWTNTARVVVYNLPAAFHADGVVLLYLQRGFYCYRRNSDKNAVSFSNGIQNPPTLMLEAPAESYIHLSNANT